MHRCSWVNDDPLYIDYHDHEWGKPVYDDQKLYEMFLLETFQAGLSWIIILHKREAFSRFWHPQETLEPFRKSRPSAKVVLPHSHWHNHRIGFPVPRGYSCSVACLITLNLPYLLPISLISFLPIIIH